jgi:DNA-binding NtrC family response regulator
MRWLQEYSWPGNIRELRNVMDRAAILCTGFEIGPEHLPLEKMADKEPNSADAVDAPTASTVVVAARVDESKRQDERRRILDALAACAGNQSRAAALLGMPRRTFVSRLETYGIPRPQKR